MAATDWIKMRVNLWHDPRVSALCESTDEGEAAVIGGLYWLWSTADAHSVDGFMPGLSTKGIDRKTGLKGFGDALLLIGWIVCVEAGIYIQNFEDHNGASAKKRAQTAKRVANHKAGVDADGEPVTPGLFDRAEEVTQKTDSGNAPSVTSIGNERDLDKNKNKKKSKPKPSSPSAQKVCAEQKELEGMGVEPQHAADWLKARKAKNLVATTTAFEQAASEAAKLGWTFPEAIAYAAGKGWGGFMAKWVENDGDTGYYGPRNGAAQGNPQSLPKNKAQLQSDQLDAAAEQFAANMAAKYGTTDQSGAGYVPPNDGNTFDME